MENDIQVRKEIARVTTTYLKNLLALNSTIITLTKDPITFDNFMSLYNKYLETIKDEDRLKREGKPTNSIKINGETISMRDLMVELKCALVVDRSDSIALNDDEINELVDYLQESIEKYGLGDIACSLNENFFMRGVLRRLRDDMAENLSEESMEKYNRVSDFMSYIYFDENIGVQPEISGRIELGYGSLFKIISSSGKTICNFTNEGVNEIPETVDYAFCELTKIISIMAADYEEKNKNIK